MNTARGSERCNLPSPVIPKPVVIITVHTSMTEGHAYNNLYYKPTGTIANVSTVQAIANAAATALYGQWSDCLSSNCVMSGLKARYQDGTHDYEAITTNANVTGNVDGDALPIQDCFEIQKRTGLAGRTARGRWFISGLSEEDQEFGKLKEDRQADIIALGNALNTPLTNGDVTLQPVHWERKTNTLVSMAECIGIIRLVSRRDRSKKEPYIPIST